MTQHEVKQSAFQRLFRSALKIPVFGDVLWWYTPYHLRLCKHLFSRERFVSTFEDDIRIWIRHNTFVEAQIYWQGVQRGDRGEIAIIKKTLKPEHVFLDIGANVGTFALVAAKLTPKGAVHAFEPAAKTHQHLLDNIALNPFTNIIANRLALSNSSGTRPLVQPDNWNPGISSLYITEGVGTEQVRTATLDDYVKASGIARIDMMKLDIEGSEMDVLEGGREAIGRYKPILMIEVNRLTYSRAGRTFESLLELLGSMGYTSHIIEHNGDYRPVKSASDLGFHQNILCLPV